MAGLPLLTQYNHWFWEHREHCGFCNRYRVLLNDKSGFPLESYSLQEANIYKEVKTNCLAKSLEVGIAKGQLRTHGTFLGHVLLLSKEKLFFPLFGVEGVNK